MNKEARKLNTDGRRAYAGAADHLPADIRVCGLGPALAMLLAETGEGPKLLFDDLAEWLLVGWPRSLGQAGSVGGDREVRFKYLVGGDQAHYRLWRGEALEFAGWLKRLARAFLRE